PKSIFAALASSVSPRPGRTGDRFAADRAASRCAEAPGSGTAAKSGVKFRDNEFSEFSPARLNRRNAYASTGGAVSAQKQPTNQRRGAACPGTKAGRP